MFKFTHTMKFFASSIIPELEKITYQNQSTTSIDLMERAARSLYERLSYEIAALDPVVVFAGPGNNGGDALAVARKLLENEFEVSVYLFNPASLGKELSPNCAINRQRLLDSFPEALIDITTEFIKPEVTVRTVIIDGLFGTGLKRPLEGGFAHVVKFINQSPGYKISIDIPSGMMSEDNTNMQDAAIIKADRTLTISFPKLAFFLPENEPWLGLWDVLDIGLDHQAVKEAPSNLYTITKSSVDDLLAYRPKFSHKGSFGHVLVVAGKWGMAGASILSAKAAYRSGAGLVTVHGPRQNCVIVQSALPEAIFQSDKADEFISDVRIPESCNVVAVGPGLGTRLDTVEMLRHLLRDFDEPMVIDADALNIMSQSRDLLELIPKNSILTPHPKEFDRLFGPCRSSFERIAKAQNAAETLGVIIVLKGAHTVIATPNQDLYFNTTGNPGMATAGSGDVLTGILAGLLAQGLPPEDAAKLGVYWHGASGDTCCNLACEESIMASDLIENLGVTFQEFRMI